MSILAPVDPSSTPPAVPPCPSRLRAPLRLNDLLMPSRFFLAPLAGYTTLAFRQTVRELGGLSLATTDLINARALMMQSRRTMEMIQTCPEDRPLAVQIYGANAEEMAAAAQWLEAYGVTAVDINMGCPVHKVVRGGGGSAMMCDAGKTVDLVRRIVEAVRIPVTVKMRLGWDDQSLSAPFFARSFEQAGVAAVTIHGRTREQGFGGRVHLDGIGRGRGNRAHSGHRQWRRAQHRRCGAHAAQHGLCRHRDRPWGTAESVDFRAALCLARDRHGGTGGDA